MGNEQTKLSQDEARRQHIQKMDTEIRRRLQKGVQYNMKVVIRGDKNTGKTTLLRRLQGDEFREEYIPSTQIQTAHIMWNYKVSDDNVKVEVWDVVDRSRDRRASSAALYTHQPNGRVPAFEDGDDDEDDGDNSRLEHLARAGSSGRGQSMAVELDATMVNVYQGTHAVIFIFDMQKHWTWQYITRSIPDVPKDMDILVLANFRDEGDRRTVSKKEIDTFFHSLDATRQQRVRYLECSLKNLFGFQQLYTFLNLPFLRLKKDYFRKQMEQVDKELDTAVEEVDIIAQEQDYHKYVEFLREAKRRRRLPSFRTQTAATSSPSPASQETGNHSSAAPGTSSSSNHTKPGNANQNENKGRSRRKPIQSEGVASPSRPEDAEYYDDFYASNRLKDGLYTDESDTNASTNITTMPYDSDDGTDGKIKNSKKNRTNYGDNDYDDDDDEEYSSDEDGEGMVMMDPTDDIEEDMSEMYISAPQRPSLQRSNNDDSEKSLDQIPSHRTHSQRDDSNLRNMSTGQKQHQAKRQDVSKIPKDDDIESFLGNGDESDDDRDEYNASFEMENDDEAFENEEEEDGDDDDDNDDNADDDDDSNHDDINQIDEEEDEPVYAVNTSSANLTDGNMNIYLQENQSMSTDANHHANDPHPTSIPGSDPPAVSDNLEIPLDDDGFFDDVDEDTPQTGVDSSNYQDNDDNDDEEEGEEEEDDDDGDIGVDDPPSGKQENDAKLKEAQEAAAAAAAKLEAELNEEEEQKKREKEERKQRRKKKEEKNSDRERKKRRKRKKKEEPGEDETKSDKKSKKKRNKSKDKEGRKRRKKKKKEETSNAPEESNE